MRRNYKIKSYLLFAFFALFFVFPKVSAQDVVIKSASEYDYPPFSITASDGEAGGFSVDLLKASLEKKGLEVSFYVDSWSNISSSLTKGEIDVLPLVGRTPERENTYDFTVPYITIYGNIFIRSGVSNINSIHDLQGKEVIVMNKDNAHEYVIREKITDQDNIITTENYEEAFNKLSKGEHDAIICLGNVGDGIINQLGIKNVFSVTTIPNFKQDFTFAVKDGNSALLAILNDGLSRTISDGTYDSIYNKWFDSKDLKFKESINYEAEAKVLALSITELLDSAVEDTLEIAGLDYANTNLAKEKIKEFYLNKQKEIWYNIGSDDGIISQTMKIPIYKEITFIDKDGIEKIKFSEGSFSNNLLNVNAPENTFYKSETYWQDTKPLKQGMVDIGRVYTKYISKAEVFSGLPSDQIDNYNKVIARDMMKQGYVRFSAPVYSESQFIGIVSLALDYRHLQELVKHTEPGNKEKVISASYEKNYILMYDIDGDTIVHPKPDNIRGVLPNGSLAGYNTDNPTNEGNIFNLYAYRKSESYQDMAHKTLIEKSVYTSSAIDVSGRAKLTVAIPIIYNNPKTNYVDIGVFGGLMLSVSVNTPDDANIEKTYIKLKALETAKEIGNYLEANPELSLSDLQSDSLFRSISIQEVGKNGYTAVIDSMNGTFYFHPQNKLENSDLEKLKNELPDWWQIMERTIGNTCSESDGTYKWKEDDGRITDKYLYTACVKPATADGKKLFVAATSYLNEIDANKYVSKYAIKSDINFARDSIKQRALDISKQIEIYLQSHPDKTLNDLKNDKLFNGTAIQPIGKTGYTYLVNHDTGIMDFHPDPKIRDKSYNNFKDDFSLIWEIIDRSVKNENCEDSEGFYEWADLNGQIRDKYTYHHCVSIKTADGYKLLIGASTYLDEYNLDTFTADSNHPDLYSYNYAKIFTYLFTGVIILVLIIVLLFYFKIIKIQGVAVYVLLYTTFITISILFLTSSYINVRNTKNIVLDNHIDRQFQIGDIFGKRIDEEFKSIGVGLEELAKIIELNKISFGDTVPYLREIKKKESDFVLAVFRLGDDSIIRSSYPADMVLSGIDLNDKSHINNLKKTLSPVISNISSLEPESNLFEIHYPILSNNNYDGSIALLLDIEFLLKKIEFFSENTISDEFYLLDQELNIISSKLNDLTGQNITNNNRLNNGQLIESIQGADKTKFVKITGSTPYFAIISPIKINDKTWYILQIETENNIYNRADSIINNIWLFTFLILLALIFLGFGSSYFLARSLKKEIDLRTVEVKDKASQIEEQLKREAEINEINKKLINEQKVSKINLEEKIEQLENFQKVIVNREIRMIELKKEVARLKQMNK